MTAFGSVDFTFTAGDAIVPTIDPARAAASTFAPFTFSGVVYRYASHADAASGVAPVASWDIVGSAGPPLCSTIAGLHRRRRHG